MQPVRDESLRRRCRRVVRPQPSLERREGARHVEPGLGDHESDGSEVRCPQPPSIDPCPSAQVAHDHGSKSTDDKGDEYKVQDTHGIREQPERQGGWHFVARRSTSSRETEVRRRSRAAGTGRWDAMPMRVSLPADLELEDALLIFAEET